MPRSKMRSRKYEKKESVVKEDKLSIASAALEQNEGSCYSKAMPSHTFSAGHGKADNNNNTLVFGYPPACKIITGA